MEFKIIVCNNGYIFIGEPASGKSHLSRLVKDHANTDDIEDLKVLVDEKVNVVYTCVNPEMYNQDNIEEVIELLGGRWKYEREDL